MTRYTITVDGRAYGGPNPDAEEDDAPGLGRTHRQGRDALRWGGEALVITGRRNLASHVDRILARLDELAPGEITIRREP